MEIAFSICNIGFGHSTRSLYVIKELERRGHEVHVLVGKPYDEFFRDKGYNTTTLTKSMNLYESVGRSWRKTLKFSSKNISKVSSSVVKARKIIKNIEPDLLVSDSEPGSIFSTREVKKIMLTHQPELFVKEDLSKLNFLWKRVINRCEKVIVPDVIGLEIPKNINDKAEKIGPLFDEIEGGKGELRNKFQIKGKTALMMPSFASAKEKDKALNIAKSLEANFIFLGQKENRRKGNVRLLKKEDVTRPCAYIKASDLVILSGYTSLMEAVYYQKPVLLIPTQTEQKKIAELGERENILESGTLKRKTIKKFIEDEELHRRIKKGQKKYHKNGVKEAVDIIESL